MRVSNVLLGAAALALVQLAPAAAQPVSVAPVSYSPQFQTSLHDTLGDREGEYLSREVNRAITAALARHGVTAGAGGVVVETTIVDADPNRPTFQQLVDRPGLDPMRSISIGGAELHAVLRGADGQVLTEVSHRRYDFTIEDVFPTTTWSAAHQAIRGFAEKVADAYVAQAG